MFGRAAKFLLVLSAVAPTALVYAWVEFRAKNTIGAVVLLSGSVLLLLTCLSLLWLAKRHLERFPFTPKSVEAADRENVAFLLLYLSPLFTSSIGSINLNIVIPTLCIFIIMTATGYSYHFNPLLGLLGWHFYKVTSEEGISYVVVTRQHLRNIRQISEVGQLTDYVLIDLG